MSASKSIPYFAAAFLGGIFLAGFTEPWALILVLCFSGITGMIGTALGKKVLIFWAVIFILVAAGGAYLKVRESASDTDLNINYGKSSDYVGVIKSDPQRGLENDRAMIEIRNRGGSAKIIGFFSPFSGIRYGEIVSFKTSVNRLKEGYRLRSGEIGAVGSVNIFEFKKESGFAGSHILSSVFNLKERLVSGLRLHISGDSGNLVAGMIFGDDEKLSKKFREDMKESGTTHLTAVSGYNFSVIFAFITPLILFLPRKRRFLALSTFSVAFALMTGAEAPVLRAGFMAIFQSAASRFERIASAGRSLILAAFCIAIQNPFAIVNDIGFHLSFAAFFGIAFVAPRISGRLKWDQGWRKMVVETFSAQLAILPITAIKFGSASLFPVIPNILVMAITPLTTVLGLMAALGSIFSSGVSAFFAFFARGLATVIIRIISFAASVPNVAKNAFSLIAILAVAGIAVFIFFGRSLNFIPIKKYGDIQK